MSVFLDMPEGRVLLRTEHFFVIEDGFPVSPGRLLVISNADRQAKRDWCATLDFN